MENNNLSLFISIAVIIILGFAVYANSLNGEFIWDDSAFVKDNVYIKNWANISKIFTENITRAGKKYFFYRPLQILTYAADYSLWGLNVKGYHLTNILLHILVALCIYHLVTILYRDNILSLFTSLLFVVHPIHTEAVTFISGRADSLATIFMLLCFIFYIKHLHVKDTKVYLLMVLSYILALLSRESSLILPVLLLLYHYAFKEKIKIKEFSSIVGIVCVYILFRLTALRPLLPHLSSYTTLPQRIPGFFVAITNYMRLILLPFNLHMEYGNILFNFNNLKAIAGILILSLLLIYAFRKRESSNLIFFSICWFFIALLPNSNLYPATAYMAEHWLYVPSIGFFLILAKILSYIYRNKNLRILAIAFIVTLVSFYSYLTIKQNEYWREPIVFYERTLEYAPNSERVLNNLGDAYRSINKKEEAIAVLEKALRINPDDEAAYINLGLTYYENGKNEEAIALYKKALELNPDYAKAYYNLGLVYYDIGKREEAINLYKKALEINPYYAKAYNNLGLAYYDIGNKKEATNLFAKAIRTDPDYADAYYNLGLAYSHINKLPQAIALFRKAIEINPNFIEGYNNLGAIYYSIGNKKEAITSYEKAIKINPDDAELYNNLGLVYSNLNKNQEAMASFRKAIEISPDFADAYNNLGAIYYNMGDKEEAMDLYKEAIKINPSYEKAYYNLGVAYYDIENKEEAMDLYKKAIEINPNYAKAYFNLGLAYINLGRRKEGIASFKKVIEINPEDALAHNNLAVAYYYEMQYDLAIKHCDKAIELGAKIHPEFLKTLEKYRK